MNHKTILDELMFGLESCEVSQEMIRSGDVHFGYSFESIAIVYPTHRISQIIRFKDGIFEVTEEHIGNEFMPVPVTQEVVSLADLVFHIHEMIHAIAEENSDENEDDEDEDEDENINWTSELQVRGVIDVPIKQEKFTTIKIGETKADHQLVIKKTVLTESEEDIQMTNVYMSLNQEEARKVLGELVKYTAS